MEPDVSVKFLERDIAGIMERMKRCGWQIVQEGVFVKVILQQNRTGKMFRLLLFCHGYPRRLISAEFLPEPFQPDRILWPDDKERMFRIRTSGTGNPFICMAGLKTYIPEDSESTVPYSMADIHIANIITRIAGRISDADCGFLEVLVK